MKTFKDRIDAGRQLARVLGRFRNERPLVLGIPRGAVTMARVIAEELGADLDVALVQKISAPGNPDYAIGAVSEFGDVFLSETAIYFDEQYLTRRAQFEIERLRRRRREYTPIRPPLDPAGRTVILVDDGIATGSTVVSAVQAARKRGASRIIVATPVSAVGVSQRIRSEADEFITLQTLWDFLGVGQFYEDNTQVTDRQVRQTLDEFRPQRRAA